MPTLPENDASPRSVAELPARPRSGTPTPLPRAPAPLLPVSPSRTRSCARRSRTPAAFSGAPISCQIWSARRSDGDRLGAAPFAKRDFRPGPAHHGGEGRQWSQRSGCWSSSSRADLARSCCRPPPPRSPGGQGGARDAVGSPSLGPPGCAQALGQRHPGILGPCEAAHSPAGGPTRVRGRDGGGLGAGKIPTRQAQFAQNAVGIARGPERAHGQTFASRADLLLCLAISPQTPRTSARCSRHSPGKPKR